MKLSVVIQDVDLEYDPADYKRLLKPIIERKADLVFGSRSLSGEVRRVFVFFAGEQMPDIPLQYDV